ncbi:MAG: TIGR03862 family flavoprotein [Verrucomicrobia bacterium]|nr:TIGR03862 family flavoprotein [Verrucomicrobiota bacterium]
MSGRLCVVGAGPAGLRAAEVAAGSGVAVAVFEAMPSAGRKFLVAGRGGLNLTNTGKEGGSKYSGLSPDLWNDLLESFGPEALRSWARDLGVQTFAVSSGRVYPEEMKSAPLLRRWIARLKSQGVEFHHRHRWTGIQASSGKWELEFQTPSGPRSIETPVVVFALGGGSWPRTGSDGRWQEAFRKFGIEVEPLVPANCGWEVPWPRQLIDEAAGQPLKNVQASAGVATAYGELLITDYGLEGGVIYMLTPALRASPVLRLDLKPAFSFEELVAKMPPGGRFHLHEAFERCRIQESARVVMKHHSDCPTWQTPAAFAQAVKSLPVVLTGPRPIEEAISSAGGIRSNEVDRNLMITKCPGIFVAGEMLDWEAPTGGFLMQGCFSTGTRAGQAAATYPGL